MKHRLAIALFACTTLLSSRGESKVLTVKPQPHSAHYEHIVRNVANMVANHHVTRLVGARGLNVVNVMWEDTGRYEGSSVGPNISDVTIEVEVEGQRGQRNYLMPVIRHPNFTDKTADVRLDKFFVRVGNQNENGRLRTISLKQLLAHPGRYMSLPNKGTIKGGSLLHKRDKHVLVSAQSAFLPVPKGGKAKFYPVIFNYQSYQDNPAVLTILATRQGTSMTIIDNSRDTVNGAGSWGQRLYFNAGGERAPLTAERLKDVMATGKTSNGESASSLGKDSNLLMLIQVPLKVKQRPMMVYDDMDMGEAEMAPSMAGSAPMAKQARSTRGADMDVAVLGHGASQGPYTELDSLTIERDPRFPVRVTVQFYQATATGEISKNHVAQVARQIKKVYSKGDYVGSLVVPDGKVQRPTKWTGATRAPAYIGIEEFPGLAERIEKYRALSLRMMFPYYRW